MRLLGISAIVLAATVFSVGGVAIVGRAGSDEAPAAQSVDATSGGMSLFQQANAHEPIGCKLPERHVVEIEPSRLAHGETVQLNTRGYNYADPGQIQLDPTGHTPAGEIPLESLPAAPKR